MDAILAMFLALLPAQEPPDPDRLESFRWTLREIEAPDPRRMLSGWRSLERSLDQLGPEGPRCLAALLEGYTGSERDRLLTLKGLLEAYFADEALFEMLDRLELPDTSRLPRVRVFTGGWRQYGSDPPEPVWMNAWLMADSGDSFECVDEAGGRSVHQRTASRTRTVFTDTRLPAPAGTGQEMGGGPFYEEISLEDEVRKLSMGGGRALVLAWHCRRRGLHVQASWLHSSAWSSPGVDGRKQAIQSLLGTLWRQALRELGGGAPRDQVAGLLRRALVLATGEEVGDKARSLAEALERMAEEDRVYQPPAPGAPEEERIRDLIRQLRDVALTPMGDPARIFISDDRSGIVAKVRGLGAAAIPDLIEVLDDPRPTRAYTWWRSFAPGSYSPLPIGRVAAEILAGITGKRMSKEEWRAWWKENQGKSERERRLQALRTGEDQERLAAIEWLLAQPDCPPAADLFECLGGIDDAYAATNTILRLQSLPREDLVAGLTPYLADRRPLVRYETARILHPHVGRRAAEAMAGILENARVVNLDDSNQWFVERRAIDWLASDRPAGLELLRDELRRGTARQKQQIIEVLAEREGADVTEVLVGAFEDGTESVTTGEYGIPRRIADLAGIAVARRLRPSEAFAWDCSAGRRDRNLRRLRNAWLQANGKPTLPEPGEAPVDREAVRQLAAVVVSGDTPAAEKARADLLDLGPGVWPQLQEEIRAAGEAPKRVLEEIASRCARTVRSVEAEGPLPVDRLRGKVLAAETLTREIIEPFLGDPRLGRLRLAVFRDPAGEGVGIEVWTEEARGPAGTPMRVECKWSVLDGDKELGAFQRPGIQEAELTTELERRLESPLRRALDGEPIRLVQVLLNLKRMPE